MRTRSGFLAMVLASAVLVSAIGMEAVAAPEYIGYSGAPGSNGRCAASCHGTSGGTIVVSGFPAEYEPNQAYSVDVTHNGGSMIKQFNASCRVGAGSQNAGVITAGASTVTYNTSGETNGVHLTTTDIMGGTFTWTAPAAGTGEVVLYVAGHQGSFSGANTTLALSATEHQTIGVEYSDLAAGFSLAPNSPNPFSAETVVSYTLPRPLAVSFEIYDLLGRRLEGYERDLPAGAGQFAWSAAGHPSGVYFLRMAAGEFSRTEKLMVRR